MSLLPVQFFKGPTNGSGQLTSSDGMLPGTVGNTWVVGTGRRSSTTPDLPSSGPTWTSLATVSPGSDRGRFYYRPVDAGDTTTLTVVGTAGGVSAVWEIPGLVTPDDLVVTDVDTFTKPATIGFTGLAPSEVGAEALILGFAMEHCSDWGGNDDFSVTDDAAWTRDGSYYINDVGDATEPDTADTTHPLLWFGHQHIAATVGTYSLTLTNVGAGNNYAGHAAVGVLFLAAPAAPVPGLWVDRRRDGFDDGTTTGSDDHRLARMLPEESVASGISDNITTDVISITIDRTADVNGGSPVGTMRVVTKNTAGKYNPDNSSSDWYGFLDPGLPGWFGCNADGTVSGTGQDVFGRFAGHLKTVAPIASGGATDAPTVEWVFEDPMARMRDGKARVEFSTTRTIQTYREDLLDSIGETRLDLTTEGDTLGMSGTLGISSQAVTGSTTALRILKFTRVDISSGLNAALARITKPAVTFVLTVLEELNAITGSQHFIAPADNKEDWYTYKTVNRNERLDDAAIVDLDGGTAGIADTSGYVHSIDGVENAMSVEARPFRVAPQPVTVWQHPSVPFAMDPPTPKIIAADFGDLVFDTDISVTSVGGGVVASATFYGDGAVIQLTSVGADTVTDVTVTGRPVERLDPIIVERDDPSSDAAYGPRQGPAISSDYMTSEGMAEGIAQYHLWANKLPRKTPSVQIYNNFADLLQLDLFDIVTLSVAQLDVSVKRFEIIGIHETWEVAASAAMVLVGFTIDLRQTPNATALTFFRIGISTLGGSDGLAP